ncbi:epoxide hydrolase family protein [Prauserella muralis]|uniref:Epoxide hydrolase n=1 Tax=Prauserella muralis TaxID=588067 RepID=A0A2V4BCD7_9PSEU|nr:epoxide hydrolase [Prauserella muralis]PXY31719.1 epoxide hydrolase [Prauserella muralis]
MTETKPFRIHVPQTDLDDLHRRLTDVRWPDEPPGIGSSRGIPLADMRSLVRRWRDGFDWRAQEERLNAFPQFVTEIDGQTIHYVHVRCGAPGALPLLLTHGWPGSFAEFLGIVEPLTADGYDVVIPSLPGFAFSTPVAETGWGNLFRVASAFAELMTRLGYERFAAHGSDVGAGVTGMLPMVAPGRVVATHINGPGPFPFGPALEVGGLGEADRVRAERFNEFQRDGLGYLHLQSTRPSTLAYSLTDSPAGQLAWIAEKYAEWTDVDLPAEDLLTVASLYWFTRSGASAAHFTYEGMQAFRAFAEQTGETGGTLSSGGVPVGVAVFATDHTIRSLVDPTGLAAHWSEYDRGGHFPALEVPGLLAGELRAFFGAYR